MSSIFSQIALENSTGLLGRRLREILILEFDRITNYFQEVFPGYPRARYLFSPHSPCIQKATIVNRIRLKAKMRKKRPFEKISRKRCSLQPFLGHGSGTAIPSISFGPKFVKDSLKS